MRKITDGNEIGKKLTELTSLPNEKQPLLAVQIAYPKQHGVHEGVRVDPVETQIFSDQINVGFRSRAWGGVRYFRFDKTGQNPRPNDIVELTILD